MGSHIQERPQLKPCPVNELGNSCRFGHTRMGSSRRNRTVPWGPARRGSWGARDGVSTSISCRWWVPKATCTQLCCVLSTTLVILGCLLEGSHCSSCSYLVSLQTNRVQSPLSRHGAGEGSSQHLPAAPRLSSKLRDFFPFFPAFESCRQRCEAYMYPEPPQVLSSWKEVRSASRACSALKQAPGLAPGLRCREVPPWPRSPASPPACSAGG